MTPSSFFFTLFANSSISYSSCFSFQTRTIFSFREERYRGITMSVKLRLMKLQFDRFTIHRFQSRPKRAGNAPFRSRGRESGWSIARQIYLAHADPFVSAYLRAAGWNERRNCKGKLTTTRPSNLAFAYFAIMESGSAISSRYRNLLFFFLVFDHVAEFNLSRCRPWYHSSPSYLIRVYI